MKPATPAIEDILPLCAMQKGILAHSLRAEGKSSYVIAAHFEVRGELDPEIFEGAWTLLAQRHPALRSMMVWEGVKEPVAVVLPAQKAEIPTQRIDLRAQTIDAADLEERVLQAYEEGFELDKAPLMRNLLLRLDERRWSWVWLHHHLILDGWCLPILLKEFFSCYQSLAASQSPRLPTAPSLREYIKWNQRKDFASAEHYWSERLGGLALPTALPYSEGGQRGVAAFRHAWSARDQEELKTSAARFGVTLNTLVQAAWGLVLRSFSGDESVVFGMTCSGRSGDWSGLGEVMTLCIDTLPLRVQVDPLQGLETWLEELQLQGQRSQQMASIGMQAMRELAGGQPFESIVVFENYPLRGVFAQEGTGFEWELKSPRSGGALEARIQERNNFPLTLVVDPGAHGELSWILAYEQSRFAPGTIAELSRRLEGWLRAFVSARPGTRLGKLIASHSSPAAAQARSEKETVRLSEPKLEDPGNWIEWHAARRGEALALVASQGQWTYKELALAVRRGARALSDAGVGPGDRVGLDLEQAQGWIAAIFAIWARGAAYVPVDPAWPDARKAQIFTDAQPTLVLKEAEPCGDPLDPRTWFDGDEDARESWPQHPGVLPAYLMYTSGSSGRAKGVVIHREALAQYSRALIDRLSLRPTQRFAFVSSPAADLGHSSVFPALCVGGTLHWIESERALSSDAYREYHQRHRIDVVKVTPSQLAVWLDCDAPEELLPQKHLISGGEALAPSLVQRILAKVPDPQFKLWNHYGPTESTVGAFAGAIQELRSEGFSMGQALPHAHGQLVDRHGLAGVDCGELRIGGAGVGQGYWRQARETARVFLPDPQASNPGQRCYASGDRVRRKADGEYYFLGRMDQQLSIRGHRIEPQELENLLLTHHAIRQVAVVAKQSTNEERAVLWAYFIKAAEAECVAEELSQWMRERVPDAWVIHHFRQLQALPLLANNKVDRRALAQREESLKPSPAPQRASNAIESEILEVWCEVLGNAEIGIQDNLFSLGGDSIHSLRIAGRLRKLGFKVTPQMIFEQPSVAQLAATLSELKREATPVARLGAGEPKLERASLLPSQRRFFEQGHPNPNHFNLSVAIPLGASAQELSLAWDTLVHRHPALCLRVSPEGQVMGPAPSLELLSVAAAQRESRWTELQQSLDPLQGRSVRAFFLQGEEGELWVIAHHLVVDVLSWGILKEELFALLRGEELAEPGLGVLHATQAWVDQERQAGAARKDIDYWQEVMAPLAGAVAAKALPQSTAVLRRHVVDVAQTQAWRDLLPSRQSYRWDRVVLSAWAQALMAGSERSEVVIECEGHGRATQGSQLDLSRSVGWFTVRFPIRLTTQESEADMVAHCGQALVESPGAGRSFAYLRYLDTSPEGRALRELPDPCFCYNHLGDLPVDPEDLAGRGQRCPQSLRSNWIELTSYLREGSLVLEWRDTPAQAPPGYESLDLAACFTQTIAGLERAVHEQARAASKESLELAASLELHRQEIGAQLEKREIPVAHVDSIYPCTTTQMGIWAATRRADDAPGMYWNQSEWELDGISLEQLRAAFSTLMQRHEVLRTRWIGRDVAQPVVVVLKRAELPLRVVDLLSEPVPRGLPESLPGQLGWELRAQVLSSGRIRCCWLRHHLLLDGWSHGLLLQELIHLLDGRSAKALCAAPSYARYLKWSGEQDRAKHRAYWKSLLAGIEPCTQLPFAPGANAGGLFVSGESQGVELCAQQCELLDRAAQECRVTQQSVAQGAFALWLSRLFGRPDPLFAVADAGRDIDLPGAEATVGLMMRTSPFAMPAVRSGIGEFLRDLQIRSAQCRSHAEIGLSEIQTMLGFAQQGLCSQLWVYENYPHPEAYPSWIHARREETGVNARTDFALVWVMEAGDTPRITLNFDSRVYFPEQVLKIVESYLSWLASLCRMILDRGEDSPVSALSLTVGVDDRAFAPIHSQYGPASTIVERFGDIVARFPECEALCDAVGSRWTYEELNAQVQQIAGALRSQGLGTEQAVGLCMRPDADLVIVMLGILHAGAYYVPVDPSTPLARAEEMLKGVEASCMVVDDDSSWPEALGACRVLRVDSLRAMPQPTPEPAPVILPQQLAYIIYTSGSTGKPKGVGVEHRNVTRLFDAAQRDMSWGPEDRWSLMHRHAFDFSVWEIFGPLLSGGQLVMVPMCERTEPAALLHRLSRSHVSMLSLTPSALLALQRSIFASPELMRSLRFVILGGEALDTRHLLPEWFEQSGAKLVNMYGITETTVHVTSTVVSAEAPLSGSEVGLPLPDQSLAVCDEYAQLLAAGLSGEFYVGGGGVSRGYMGQARLTAARFLPDPLGAPGSRRYKTGDRGQLDRAGRWCHEGRLDQQVQIRGHRIELGEIEARLLQSPQIEDARVFACPEERSLWAYVVTKEPLGLDQERLRIFLSQWLPEYMIPRIYMEIESFPRTVNGKLDRALLPHPDKVRTPKMPLISEVEQGLAGIWSLVLDRPVENRDADFFALGGQSIAAMRVSDEVRRRFGKELPVQQLFEKPLLQDQARFIESEAARSRPVRRIPKRRGKKRG